MKYTHMKNIVGSLLVLAALSACSFSLSEDITPPPGSQQEFVLETQPVETVQENFPLVPPDPQNGKEIYREKCASCHGETGQGDGAQAGEIPNPVIAIGSPEIARQSVPIEWYSKLDDGDHMPDFSSMSDRQSWDVVAYLYTLSIPDLTAADGAELYRTYCAGCHGESGGGNGPSAGALSKKPVDFTDQAFMAERAISDFYQTVEDGISSDMPSFADKFDQDEIWAVAHFIRTISFTSQETINGSDITGDQVEGDKSGETPDESTEVSEQGNVRVGVNFPSMNIDRIPETLTVTLHGFDGMQPVFTETASIELGSSILFENLQLPEGRAFLAYVDYEGISYSSDVYVVEEGDELIDLPILLYGTTTDSTGLIVDRMHIILERINEQSVRLTELYIMSNPTDSTLVATEDSITTVSFPLPEDAVNLDIQDGVLGDRFVKTSEGFGDTAPIRPGMGSYQVLFSFDIPFEGNLDLVQQIPYPVEALVIMVPEDNIKVSGDKIEDVGVREMQGTSYHIYNGSVLAFEDDLSMSLSGEQSRVISTLFGTHTDLIIGLGAFGVTLVVVGIWWYRRNMAKSKKDQAQQHLSDYELPQIEDSDTVMDAIIALDDLFREGKLPPDAYRTRRSELKEKLREQSRK